MRVTVGVDDGVAVGDDVFVGVIVLVGVGVGVGVKVGVRKLPSSKTTGSQMRSASCAPVGAQSVNTKATVSSAASPKRRPNKAMQ
ncbi:MAG: hypothetical protein EPO26_10765 [Chloroflexota bacterium]|nr:MAG: hypothetical protein EPO26_10765 [Chloroflexota bacterium]